VSIFIPVPISFFIYMMAAGDNFFGLGGGGGSWVPKRENSHSVGLQFLPTVPLHAMVFGHRVNFILHLLLERRYKLCVLPVDAVPDPEVFTTPSGTGSLSTPM
jgi:hypothetical protein